MPQELHLDVFVNADPVGSVFDTNPISFAYSPDWLAQPNTPPLGGIAKQEGRQDGAAVNAFFDNLLPEAGLRAYLGKKHKASTVFALLRAVGGDSAGAFVILPAGKRPQAAKYERTTWKAIAKALAANTAMAADIKVKDARISLAGAQDKTALALAADGTPLLPRGTSPSTHILKPDIKRFKGVWSSAANEAILMRTARACELVAANVFYEASSRSCVVERFDRLGTPPGRIERLVQFDLCQLSDTPSAAKYETEGGPGLQRCAQLIRLHSSRPALDLRRLVQWVFFNLYAGNNDSHAKNLSIYYPASGPALSPFYDLMSTRLYPGLSATFAFSIAGETAPGKIGRKHVVAMSENLGMRPEFVLGLARGVAERLPRALETAVAELQPAFSHSENVLAERLAAFVTGNTRKLLARIQAQAR